MFKVKVTYQNKTIVLNNVNPIIEEDEHGRLVNLFEAIQKRLGIKTYDFDIIQVDNEKFNSHREFSSCMLCDGCIDIAEGPDDRDADVVPSLFNKLNAKGEQ